MNDTDPREEFMRLYLREKGVQRLAVLFGLSAEEMGLALHYARLSRIINAAQTPRRPITVPPPPSPLEPTNGRVFCGQCDRAVYPDEAVSCRSRWCKAKVAA